jgi:hypothetical protein
VRLFLDATAELLADIEALEFRAVFRQFVLLCRRLDLYGRELLAVDGTRIKAVNNKDRNFTRSSLRAFIHAADERLDYLKRLDEGDVADGATSGGARTKNLAEKIAALSEKRGRYGLDAEDVERAAQIIGERGQAELGAHVGEAAHQEGALIHPLLDAAERVLDDLAAAVENRRPRFEALGHAIENVLVFEAEN